MGKRDRETPSWVRFSGVGIEFSAAVAGFTLVGYWIDSKYDSRPWGVLIGAILGLVGGMYNLIRVSLAAVRDQQPDRDRNADGHGKDESA
jgi:F0F1-type ATP synthase assembly protein I